MNEKIAKILISILTFGLIVCAIFLYQQNAQLKSLQAQLAAQEEHLDRIEKALETSRARQASNIKIRSLSSGIYELSTEVTVDPFEAQKDEYTIYNFVLDIRVGAMQRKLQFGYAYSGVLTHVIYFDHDSDGTIDTEMMNDYAKSIPGLEMVAGWLIEPEHSQAVYDAFRLNVDLAEQVTMDGVASSADAKIGVLWTWLNGQSEGLSKWIEEAIEYD
jgi:hypothetical protein